MYDEESKIIIESKDYVNIKDKYKKLLDKKIFYNFKINKKIFKFFFIIFIFFFIKKLCYNKNIVSLNSNKKLFTKFSNYEQLSTNKIKNITQIFKSTNNINKNDSFIINKYIYSFINNIINKELLYNGNSLIKNNIYKNNSYVLVYQNNIINNHINLKLQNNMNFTIKEFNIPFKPSLIIHFYFIKR